jgi:hypothetical protein
MPVQITRRAPPREPSQLEIERRETFIRLQKKFYLGGKKGKFFEGMLVSLAVSDVSARKFLTIGVVTCLKAEFKRGQNEQD